jgi:hypothetical protein
VSAIGERVGTALRERGTRHGKVPRVAYAHYFIEAEGLHSRIHLQNFWSTFWPDIDRPAIAHIQAFDASGRALGTLDRAIPRFGSMFLEVREVLAALGSDAAEGIVAIDLEPDPEVRRRFADLPRPAEIHARTPFWMAYYDDDSSYMYVHSIETLAGEMHGAPKLVSWSLTRAVGPGHEWRSWRLIEAERLTELQIVAINHAPEPRSTTIGVFGAGGGEPLLYSETHDFAPRSLRRVQVPSDQVAGWYEAGHRLVRVGLDPLLTGNGKPYVLMRYDGGPLSLHHG